SVGGRRPRALRRDARDTRSVGGPRRHGQQCLPARSHRCQCSLGDRRAGSARTRAQTRPLVAGRRLHAVRDQPREAVSLRPRVPVFGHTRVLVRRGLNAPARRRLLLPADAPRLAYVNLIEALAGGVGPRAAGSEAGGRAAETVADAFRELGLEPRFQEFDLVAYDADEPELEIEGERWDAGPCMYAHAFDGEGTVRRIGESNAPVGDGKRPNFPVVHRDRREVARLLTSPFSTGAIPFMSPHVHITTPPTAFVSRADSDRLRDGMRVRLKVSGRFLPGRLERNVIAELPGGSTERVIVSA